MAAAIVLLITMMVVPELGTSDAGPEAEATSREPRTEFGAVPVAGGDTDYGVGAGLLANLAGFSHTARPYAWRLEAGIYRPWEPDATGRWQSEEIAVAIGLEGTLATVYTRHGERQLREGEVSGELAKLRRLVE